MNYDLIFSFYNDYKYLKGAIISISSQALLPNNLIFIDDGNNDNKLKDFILKNLNEKVNLIYIKNEINIGTIKSINIALEKIKSTFFYICSSDDIIYQNFAKESLEKLNDNPEYPFVFSNIIINNEMNNKKYFIKYSFLKKDKYSNYEVKKIFKQHQFKIYHNTVFFRSNYFLNSHLFKPSYGDRCDMLNLYYISFKHGFLYLDQDLSEFTFRQGQQGRPKNDKYLLNELIFLKKHNHLFYRNYIDCCLHYDFSPFAIYFFLKFKLYEVISLKWIVRSVKFKIWKKIRFLVPNCLLTFLFNILN